MSEVNFESDATKLATILELMKNRTINNDPKTLEVIKETNVLLSKDHDLLMKLLHSIKSDFEKYFPNASTNSTAFPTTSTTAAESIAAPSLSLSKTKALIIFYTCYQTQIEVSEGMFLLHLIQLIADTVCKQFEDFQHQPHTTATPTGSNPETPLATPVTLDYPVLQHWMEVLVYLHGSHICAYQQTNRLIERHVTYNDFATLQAIPVDNKLPQLINEKFSLDTTERWKCSGCQGFVNLVYAIFKQPEVDAGRFPPCEVEWFLYEASILRGYSYLRLIILPIVQLISYTDSEMALFLYSLFSEFLENLSKIYTFSHYTSDTANLSSTLGGGMGMGGGGSGKTTTNALHAMLLSQQQQAQDFGNTLFPNYEFSYKFFPTTQATFQEKIVSYYDYQEAQFHTKTIHLSTETNGQEKTVNVDGFFGPGITIGGTSSTSTNRSTRSVLSDSMTDSSSLLSSSVRRRGYFLTARQLQEETNNLRNTKTNKPRFGLSSIFEDDEDEESKYRREAEEAEAAEKEEIVYLYEYDEVDSLEDVLLCYIALLQQYSPFALIFWPEVEDEEEDEEENDRGFRTQQGLGTPHYGSDTPHTTTPAPYRSYRNPNTPFTSTTTPKGTAATTPNVSTPGSAIRHEHDPTRSRRHEYHPFMIKVLEISQYYPEELFFLGIQFLTATGNAPGYVSCQYVYDLLAEGVCYTDGGRKTSILQWDEIFGRIDKLIQMMKVATLPVLTTATATSTASNVPVPTSQATTATITSMDIDGLRVLLELISMVVHDTTIACFFLTDYSLIDRLFFLLTCALPIDIKGLVFHIFANIIECMHLVESMILPSTMLHGCVQEQDVYAGKGIGKKSRVPFHFTTNIHTENRSSGSNDFREELIIRFWYCLDEYQILSLQKYNPLSLSPTNKEYRAHIPSSAIYHRIIYGTPVTSPVGVSNTIQLGTNPFHRTNTMNPSSSSFAFGNPTTNTNTATNTFGNSLYGYGNNPQPPSSSSAAATAATTTSTPVYPTLAYATGTNGWGTNSVLPSSNTSHGIFDELTNIESVIGQYPLTTGFLTFFHRLLQATPPHLIIALMTPSIPIPSNTTTTTSGGGTATTTTAPTNSLFGHTTTNTVPMTTTGTSSTPTVFVASNEVGTEVESIPVTLTMLNMYVHYILEKVFMSIHQRYYSPEEDTIVTTTMKWQLTSLCMMICNTILQFHYPIHLLDTMKSHPNTNDDEVEEEDMKKKLKKNTKDYSKVSSDILDRYEQLDRYSDEGKAYIQDFFHLQFTKHVKIATTVTTTNYPSYYYPSTNPASNYPYASYGYGNSLNTTAAIGNASLTNPTYTPFHSTTTMGQAGGGLSTNPSASTTYGGWSTSSYDNTSSSTTNTVTTSETMKHYSYERPKTIGYMLLHYSLSHDTFMQYIMSMFAYLLSALKPQDTSQQSSTGNGNSIPWHDYALHEYGHIFTMLQIAFTTTATCGGGDDATSTATLMNRKSSSSSSSSSGNIRGGTKIWSSNAANNTAYTRRNRTTATATNFTWQPSHTSGAHHHHHQHHILQFVPHWQDLIQGVSNSMTATTAGGNTGLAYADHREFVLSNEIKHHTHTNYLQESVYYWMEYCLSTCIVFMYELSIRQHTFLLAYQQTLYLQTLPKTKFYTADKNGESAKVSSSMDSMNSRPAMTNRLLPFTSAGTSAKRVSPIDITTSVTLIPHTPSTTTTSFTPSTILFSLQDIFLTYPQFYTSYLALLPTSLKLSLVLPTANVLMIKILQENILYKSITATPTSPPQDQEYQWIGSLAAMVVHNTTANGTANGTSKGGGTMTTGLYYNEFGEYHINYQGLSLYQHTLPVYTSEFYAAYGLYLHTTKNWVEGRGSFEELDAARGKEGVVQEDEGELLDDEEEGEVMIEARYFQREEEQENIFGSVREALLEFFEVTLTMLPSAFRGTFTTTNAALCRYNLQYKLLGYAAHTLTSSSSQMNGLYGTQSTEGTKEHYHCLDAVVYLLHPITASNTNRGLMSGSGGGSGGKPWWWERMDSYLRCFHIVGTLATSGVGSVRTSTLQYLRHCYASYNPIDSYTTPLSTNTVSTIQNESFLIVQLHALVAYSTQCYEEFHFFYSLQKTKKRLTRKDEIHYHVMKQRILNLSLAWGYWYQIFYQELLFVQSLPTTSPLVGVVPAEHTYAHNHMHLLLTILFTHYTVSSSHKDKNKEATAAAAEQDEGSNPHRVIMMLRVWEILVNDCVFTMNHSVQKFSEGSNYVTNGLIQQTEKLIPKFVVDSPLILPTANNSSTTSTTTETEHRWSFGTVNLVALMTQLVQEQQQQQQSNTSATPSSSATTGLFSPLQGISSTALTPLLKPHQANMGAGRAEQLHQCDVCWNSLWCVAYEYNTFVKSVSYLEYSLSTFLTVFTYLYTTPYYQGLLYQVLTQTTTGQGQAAAAAATQRQGNVSSISLSNHVKQRILSSTTSSPVTVTSDMSTSNTAGGGTWNGTSNVRAMVYEEDMEEAEEKVVYYTQYYWEEIYLRFLTILTNSVVDEESSGSSSSGKTTSLSVLQQCKHVLLEEVGNCLVVLNHYAIHLVPARPSLKAHHGVSYANIFYYVHFHELQSLYENIYDFLQLKASSFTSSLQFSTFTRKTLKDSSSDFSSPILGKVDFSFVPLREGSMQTAKKWIHEDWNSGNFIRWECMMIVILQELITLYEKHVTMLTAAMKSSAMKGGSASVKEVDIVEDEHMDEIESYVNYIKEYLRNNILSLMEFICQLIYHLSGLITAPSITEKSKIGYRQYRTIALITLTKVIHHATMNVMTTNSKEWRQDDVGEKKTHGDLTVYANILSFLLEQQSAGNTLLYTSSFFTPTTAASSTSTTSTAMSMIQSEDSGEDIVYATQLMSFFTTLITLFQSVVTSLTSTSSSSTMKGQAMYERPIYDMLLTILVQCRLLERIYESTTIWSYFSLLLYHPTHSMHASTLPHHQQQNGHRTTYHHQQTSSLTTSQDKKTFFFQLFTLYTSLLSTIARTGIVSTSTTTSFLPGTGTGNMHHHTTIVSETLNLVYIQGIYQKYQSLFTQYFHYFMTITSNATPTHAATHAPLSSTQGKGQVTYQDYQLLELFVSFGTMLLRTYSMVSSSTMTTTVAVQQQQNDEMMETLLRDLLQLYYWLGNTLPRGLQEVLHITTSSTTSKTSNNNNHMINTWWQEISPSNEQEAQAAKTPSKGISSSSDPSTTAAAAVGGGNHFALIPLDYSSSGGAAHRYGASQKGMFPVWSVFDEMKWNTTTLMMQQLFNVLRVITSIPSSSSSQTTARMSAGNTAASHPHVLASSTSRGRILQMLSIPQLTTLIEEYLHLYHTLTKKHTSSSTTVQVTVTREMALWQVHILQTYARFLEQLFMILYQILVLHIQSSSSPTTSLTSPFIVGGTLSSGVHSVGFGQNTIMSGMIPIGKGLMMKEVDYNAYQHAIHSAESLLPTQSFTRMIARWIRELFESATKTNV